MKSINIKDLLAQCLSDGFSVESICKATSISPIVLHKYFNDLPLLSTEIAELKYLPVFLTQLYLNDPIGKSYIIDILDSLNYFFSVSDDTIARYIGINSDSLRVFLDDIDSNSVEYQLVARKIMHLFLTFMRDKKHS